MKTLIVDKEGVLSVLEIPMPTYTSKQALVKMISCGMCGTDAHLIEGKFKGVPKDMYPVMLGHEGVGEVVEVGSEVTSYKKGDIVLLPFLDPEPSFGDIGSAWGAYSEYGVVHDQKAYSKGEEPECAFGQNLVPEDIDPVDAAMMITFREVLSNIKYFGIKKGEPIVVYGCGPVGLTFIKFMSLLGVHPVIAVARNKEKQENALKNGADIVLNSSECDVCEEVHKIYPDGVPYVLDAVGSPDVINEGMKLICDRGEVLCYGVPKTEQITIDFSRAPYNWKLNFQQFPRKDEEALAYQQILTWLRNGDIKFEDYISDYYEFDDILQAFEDYGNKKILKKGIIKYKR
ncbi:MAG: zinc-binding dehydrogenase [Lachnospiraceae bacterium]